MTCNCISTIEGELADHKLDIAIMFREGQLTSETFTALLRRDNGRKESRSNKPKIFAHKFCPFCGVAYAEAERPSDLVLLWSGEHHAYWRPDSAGYTIDGLAAGAYVRSKAQSIIDGVGPEKKLEIREIPYDAPIFAAQTAKHAAKGGAA